MNQLDKARRDRRVLLRFFLTTPVRKTISLAAIVLPLKRLEVMERIGTAFGDWFDVVDFPALEGGFAIVGALHARAEDILSKTDRVLVCFSSIRPRWCLRRMIHQRWSYSVVEP